MSETEYRVSVTRDRWANGAWQVQLEQRDHAGRWVWADMEGHAMTKLGARWRARRMLRLARSGRFRGFEVR